MPEVRVMVDGVFDCTHFGHANSLRQAKMFGNIVVAGIHPESEILKHKHCSPVFKEEERYALTKALRYADEVVENVPYEFGLKEMADYGVDLVAHGNEPVFNAIGQPIMQDVKEAGNYRYFPRTNGTCTTDVIEAVLHLRNPENTNKVNPKLQLGREPLFINSFDKLLTANQLITEGCDSLILPPDDYDLQHCIDNKVVFAFGNFEIFNYGHLCFLQKAAKLGRHLLVGVQSDMDLVTGKSRNAALLNNVQRAANIISYKCVDGVVLLPEKWQEHIDDLVKKFGIATVALGRNSDYNEFSDKHPNVAFIEVNSGSDVTTSAIVNRIMERSTSFTQRNYFKHRF